MRVDYTALSRFNKAAKKASVKKPSAKKTAAKKNKGYRSYKGSEVVITIEEAGLYAQISGSFPVSVVDKATSFAVKGARFSSAYKKGRWDGRTRFMKRPANRVPVGLLHLAVEELEKRDVKITVKDNRKNFISGLQPVAVKLLPVGFELREYQKECVEAAYRAGRGIIHMATNSGKTECLCALIKSYGTSFKALVLVRGLELLDQMLNRISLRLGIPVEKIGKIGDSSCTYGHWITVATPDTLYSRRQDLSVKNFLSSIELVILDEAHHGSSDSYYKVLEGIAAPHRFGMSGTPLSRSDGADMKLMAQTGPVIFKVTNKDLIELGHSVPVTIEFARVTSPNLPEWYQYPQAVKEGIVNNLLRSEKICNGVLSMVKEGRSVLVLVQRIDHGKILGKILEGLDPKNKIPHQFISGKETSGIRREALDKFKRGDLKVLISSTILDEGVDVPSIEGLVLAGGGKAKIGSLQRIGRGLRTGGKFPDLRVLDCADMTHHYLAEHSLRRLKIYRKEKVFNIVISDL